MSGPTPDILGRLEPICRLSVERRGELAAASPCRSFPIGADPLADDARAGIAYLVRGELLLRLAGGGSKVLVGACDEARWPLPGKMGELPSGRAITEVVLMYVDAAVLDIMMTWEQMSLAVPLAAGVEDVAMLRTVTGALNLQTLTGEGFSLLPPAHIHELLMRFERIKVKAGQVVIREGEVGDYYYLIESGKCVVTRRVGGSDVHVADLRAGEAFGEEALVSESCRSATVTMKTAGVLLRLAKPDFVELLKAPLLQVVSRAEAEARVAAGEARWLDVRYAAEYAEDGFPGALNVPLNEIRSAFEVLDRDQEYVVYCQSGRRSSAAAFLLAQHGLKAVWLEGGLAGKDNEKT